LAPKDLLFSPIESAAPAEAAGQETNLEELEKVTIQRVLQQHGGNLTRAAKELGITRTALYRRMSKYGL
jgi:transcriptional regulator with PAS, ATPase and Fis domain